MVRHHYLRLWTFCTLTEEYVPPGASEDPDEGYWELRIDIKKLITNGEYAKILGAPP